MKDDANLGARARQKLARRAAILEAAECAFGADGGVAVESIALAAGLAKGTIYNYFPDKAALADAVTLAVEQRLLGEVESAAQFVAPAARLALVLCALLEGAAADEGAAAIARRRMEDRAAQGGAIGRTIAAALWTSGYASALTEEEQSAALTLILGAVGAAMGAATMPRTRRRTRDGAIAALCLRAVGANCDVAEAQVSAAMSALSATRRAAIEDWRGQSHAH